MPTLDLTQEEVNNLIALINRAQITGAEALPVALLLQKISQQNRPLDGAQPNRAERRRQTKQEAKDAT